MEVAEPSPAATSTGDEPLFKKRSAKSKSNFRKRPATPPPAEDSDSSAYSSSEDEAGHKIKRRRKNAGAIKATTSSTVTAKDLEATKFAADRSRTIDVKNDATKQSNWYDETSTDALSSKNLLGTTRSRPSATSDDPGAKAGDSTYKGQANYQGFIQKNPNAPSRQVGPVKAPTNIRTITITDFAPDVCKDYKQTGFCGFGDSCKFLHAREDYKQGWELDRDWEIGSKGKKSKNVDQGDDDEVPEDIPFACIICKEPYKNPIQTKCGHYFCEACALKRYRKDPSCAACGASTNGVFNTAKNLRKILDRKKAAQDKEEEEAGSAEDGDD
ncbi:MAG: hypothetical protein M4579_002846 [Chaenotheca gracillima]|nr:MAG: hypothetical protein M4579_002846 [Chaenotheca gracillima]